MKHLVVIDTNVVLSALQSKNGKSFGLISKIGSGLFDFAISVPLILEYEAILKNHLDRNIFSDSDIEDFIDYIKFKTTRFLPCNGKRNNRKRRNFNKSVHYIRCCRENFCFGNSELSGRKS